MSQRYDYYGERPRPNFSNLRLSDLRRSRVDKRIMGVCGGIAEWLGVSSLGIRLAGLALMFLTGPVIMLGYLALGVLVARAPRPGQPWNRGPMREEGSGSGAAGRGSPAEEPDFAPAEAILVLNRRFGAIEERMRLAEAEVTSARFRIARELKKTGP